jgi:hypothetical protein
MAFLPLTALYRSVTQCSGSSGALMLLKMWGAVSAATNKRSSVSCALTLPKKIAASGAATLRPTGAVA